MRLKTQRQKWLRQLLILAFVLQSWCSVSAQKAGANRLAFAKAFLRAEYPELQSRKWITVCAQDEARMDTTSSFDILFYVGVYEGTSRCLSGTETEAVKRPTILASFNFGRAGYIDDYFSSNADDARSTLKELVNLHPEWSDDAVVAEIERAGARFGPNHEAEFRKQLNLRRRSQYLGEIRIRNIYFDLRDSVAHEEGRPSAQLTWVVNGRVKRGSTWRKCVLLFEPTAGQLVNFLVR